MTVRRIVANIAVEDVANARAFYGELLGLSVVMDHGWIMTFAAEAAMRPQVSFAVEGGAGAPVPDLSIEVDDIDAIYGRAVEEGWPVEYDLTDEPWGVRRFFVRDPFGRLVNILVHR